MKATPRNLSLLFAAVLFFWAVLTAGDNARRFFSGEFYVLSPFRHMGLLILIMLLTGALYLILRRALPHSERNYEASDPYTSLPTFDPRPLLPASLDRARQESPPNRLLPSSASNTSSGKPKGFDYPSRHAHLVSVEEHARAAGLAWEAAKLLGPNERIDLTPWSEGNTLPLYETLLNWYNERLAQSAPASPHPSRPSPRSRHLRLIEDDS